MQGSKTNKHPNADRLRICEINYGEENYKLFVDLEMPRRMEVHLDTDEGNACMLKDATSYELLKTYFCIFKIK